MLIILKKFSHEKDIKLLTEKLSFQKIKFDLIQIEEKTVISVLDAKKSSELTALEALEIVEKVIQVDKPYKFVSKEYKSKKTLITVGDTVIGSSEIIVIAGPCAVENREQIFETALAVKEAGAKILRGGVFKPRTSPYSFQGLGEEGLRYLKEAADKSGLPIITEVLDVRSIDMVCKYSDIIQIGSRNMQNSPLLKELSRVDKPVMLKRGLSATIEEWLLAAEYLVSGGNSQVILCERGIRTFENFTRNTLDLSAVPIVKELSHLPIFVDPSHGTGKWKLVSPMAKASIACGADGLMIEVHPNPSQALSDGEQSLNFEKFKELMRELELTYKKRQDDKH